MAIQDIQGGTKRIIEVTCDGKGRLRRVPLEKLQRFQGALKSLGEDQYRKLKDSIAKHGFFVPVFVWRNKILDGHQRLLVIEKEQWAVRDGVPVVDIEAETESDAAEKLLLISSTYGKIEPQGLYDFTELHDIPLTVSDLPDLPDFDLEGFKNAFYEEEEEDEGAADDVPDAPEVPIGQTGDLWLLGDHRLLCGDSTSGEDVARLMDGRQADMGLTSPPYAVGKEYEEDVSFAEHLKLLEAVADSALETIKPGGFFFINFDEIAAMAHAGPLTGSSRACIYPISIDYWRIFHVDRRCDLYAQRVWYKPFNRLQQPFWSYHTSIPHYQEWENIWTWRMPGGGKDQVHDWDISSRAVWDTREESTDDRPLTRHVAAFPVCLPERAIRAHTEKGAIVWEPFSGSGSTIIACHNLGRIGFGMEKNPQYCDVTVLRWQDYTGQEAKLEGDGRTFGEVAEERSGTNKLEDSNGTGYKS